MFQILQMLQHRCHNKQASWANTNVASKKFYGLTAGAFQLQDKRQKKHQATNQPQISMFKKLLVRDMRNENKARVQTSKSKFDAKSYY